MRSHSLALSLSRYFVLSLALSLFLASPHPFFSNPLPSLPQLEVMLEDNLMLPSNGKLYSKVISWVQRSLWENGEPLERLMEEVSMCPSAHCPAHFNQHFYMSVPSFGSCLWRFLIMVRRVFVCVALYASTFCFAFSSPSLEGRVPMRAYTVRAGT